MEKEKAKPYTVQDVKPAFVEKQFVMYGTLSLDETKRYTYADYLTFKINEKFLNGYPMVFCRL